MRPRAGGGFEARIIVVGGNCLLDGGMRDGDVGVTLLSGVVVEEEDEVGSTR